LQCAWPAPLADRRAAMPPSAAIAHSAAAAQAGRSKEKKEKEKEKEREREAESSGHARVTKEPPAMTRRHTLGMTVFGSHFKCGAPLRRQEDVRAFYASAGIQKFVAGLIVLNFLINVLEKEIDPPKGEKFPIAWMILEDLFNVIFLIELVVNFYGTWFWEFWKSGWNVFDFIVVMVGCMSLARLTSPESPLGLLRMLRAFRVFRLFKRIKSLNKIIMALGRAIPGVTNAFVIMIICTAIYSMLAVEFFATFGEKGYYVNYLTNETVSAVTARGSTLGFEYYGCFTRAFYTMWQVLTGESWSEAIVRPLLFGWERADGPDAVGFYLSAAGVALFFCSFLIVCAIVLINVVVAVLLEKMVEPEENDEDDEETVDGHSPVLPAGADDAPTYKEHNSSRVHPMPPGGGGYDDVIDLQQGVRVAAAAAGGGGGAGSDASWKAETSERLAAVEAKLDKLLSLLETRGAGAPL